ncbi:squalene/phytoene synthase family protein [Planktothrix agardhii]|jgi:farnesyl-diphosphate farnesyltransferase|uniref:squalene/phytoene synthase family protein n=2 Tax=Planktothrix agardhii TaxID=1160 RepID=UPI001D0BAE86|nr:phytoene/squalene synthase family protein [Planktothrix agardhii]MCB8788855.1 phytoene/squalene synthase family protein [Planktothrix agardhii 1025]MCF3614118.1 phytoene/squalene synthase family protein [Planktothrix agardhii 1027]MCF3647771.1 phytoene/squalene synthase family protein [Planktothrix agardhii 1026]MDS1348528.1 phytoene/squalene synthase family protein [Planktothrix agardhii NRERC-751]CAD5983367.1 Squalene synthase [Planktothrix agardhii]
MNNSQNEALEVLQETSRTFYIPITLLPSQLQEAVVSAYLCMRAIDEIEDHPGLDNPTKAFLLRRVSETLQEGTDKLRLNAFSEMATYQNVLPEVTLRIQEWALLAPQTIWPRIWDTTAAMADRMAYWAHRNWEINTEADLDRYTFSVAGTVGLLLSELWMWYDNTRTNRIEALGFGRGLQAVNILRNHAEDLKRGVDFFPNGWSEAQMHAYARQNLSLADAYTNSLPQGPVLDFCAIPLALAHATLDALSQGEAKLSRTAVMGIIEGISSQRRLIHRDILQTGGIPK